MNIGHLVYNLMVNRITGISYRYHKFHDGTTGIMKIISWFYLMWLNFAYYVLFCRFLGKKPGVKYYESKCIPTRLSESQAYLKSNPELNVLKYVNKLKEYDVISFDIFDTLIFRPLSAPADVFYLVGERFDNIDFKNIRAWAEWDARMKCSRKNGHTEITLDEIWQNMSEDTGLSKTEGIDVEQKTECSLCYANPFMLEVWRQLRGLGKRMIVVSDMYLSKRFLESMLEKAGFTGAEKIYVSSEYRKNKASGTLFQLVKKELGDVSVIHVGDNPHSDYTMARKNGFAVCPYLNVNQNILLYRAFDMSYIVGSAYRGIVNNHLYNGLYSYSMEYEYGFVYGGLFVLGYCNFIHEYSKLHGIDKVLFLSRDGDIIKQAYDFLYPGENAEYVYWSRKAAAKLMANEDKHDYFRRFIYHKINQKYTIKKILEMMELDFLVEQLSDWNGKTFKELRPNDELTDKNSRMLRDFIEAEWDQVIAAYGNQQKAAKMYYQKVLENCGKAAAVDIGWAGSGALALSHLASKVWDIPCEIIGIIAGTNTIHNVEPDASEPFLQNGRLEAYLFSQSHNRDLLKKHDPNKDYNIFWELLLSSPTPQFSGFYEDENGQPALSFGGYDANQEGIREIQRGILDFVHEYQKRFQDFPYMFRISGRDAYAPMLAAASHNEKYLRAIAKKFSLVVNVN